MTEPFYRLPIRRNRDLLRARQKSRQIAHLLHFGPNEEACIVAGTFAVGLQAREHLPAFDLCFSLESGSLVIQARAKKSENLTPTTIADGERQLLQLRKRLPDRSATLSTDDLAWMIGQVDHSAPPRLFAEMVRQNQEVLMLLHELHLLRGQGGIRDSELKNPEAA